MIDARIAFTYDPATASLDTTFPKLDISLGDMKLTTDLGLLNMGADKFKSLTRAIFVSVLDGTVREAVPPLLKSLLGLSLTLPEGAGSSYTLHMAVNAPPVIKKEGLSLDVSVVPGFSPVIGLVAGAVKAALRTGSVGPVPAATEPAPKFIPAKSVPGSGSIMAAVGPRPAVDLSARLSKDDAATLAALLSTPAEPHAADEVNVALREDGPAAKGPGAAGAIKMAAPRAAVDADDASFPPSMLFGGEADLRLI